MDKTMLAVKYKENDYTFPKGTKFIEIKNKLKAELKYPIIALRVNNIIKELNDHLEEDCAIEFVDISDDDGIRIYQRGLCFVLVRAAQEVFPDSKAYIDHSLSRGLYCEIKNSRPILKEGLRQVEERMREIIENDEPFVKEKLAKKDAVELFEMEGMSEKVSLLKNLKKEFFFIYYCGWLVDYFYGYMPPSTGILKTFELMYYPPGLILRFPEKSNPLLLPEFIDNPKLASVFHEYKEWSQILEVPDVGALNNIIESGEINDLIRVAEALQEKKIAQIADMVTKNIRSLRLVLIAGPSSSGKTTFAQRLAVQLRVNGLKPVAISLDDYFVNREDTPRDEDGNFDFENINALDLELFNDNINRLIYGEEVEIPRFDFTVGKRKPQGKKLKITPEHLLIVEGIHGLNEKLTESVSKSNKYKIYISALTQLNLDEHNRIPTTDSRLLRRIVRDYQFRNHSALDTIKMWQSVRKGEDKNIFPFQEEADVMFNSALIYELAVLKDFAKTQLEMINQNLPEFAEARRLLTFLEYFIGVGTDEIPTNSILREFIGATCFFKTDL
ncbi:MAG: nucleoside kinase [Armatimonadota bacterium]